MDCPACLGLGGPHQHQDAVDGLVHTAVVPPKKQPQGQPQDWHIESDPKT